MKIAAVIQPCSVRAIAYQLFSQHLIESMAKKNVNRVSNLCVIARRRHPAMEMDYRRDPE